LIPYINIHTHQIDVHADRISIVDYLTTALEQKEQLPFFSAGIHPWLIDIANINLQFNTLNVLALNSNCVAIGECGLDKLKGPDISLQIPIFEKQIALAQQIKKPVIVHCVKAFDVLSNIIKKHQGKTSFIIHGFNQNEQVAHQFIKLGAYLSFGAALIHEKNDRLRAIFEQTPIENIFLENDDSPTSINQIYERAASLKNFELDVMKELIFANFKKVFTHE
jgi:TatD DNase family protein